MSNPLFKRKPIRETIAFKISTRGIPPLTRAMQERIENRARDPSLHRSFPEMEEIGDLMSASLENDRHRRLTKQRWSGTDEKEWLENGKTTVPGCEPGPSVSGDSISED